MNVAGFITVWALLLLFAGHAVWGLWVFEEGKQPIEWFVSVGVVIGWNLERAATYFHKAAQGSEDDRQ